MVQVNEFITAVKQDCVIKQYYFWFNQIPDLIVKREYPRKMYEENILKVLKKVQTLYLAEKKADAVDAGEMEEKEIAKLQVNDDDMVPLRLFDEVLSQMEHKIMERNRTIRSFIQECLMAT